MNTRTGWLVICLVLSGERASIIVMICKVGKHNISNNKLIIIIHRKTPKYSQPFPPWHNDRAATPCEVISHVSN